MMRKQMRSKRNGGGATRFHCDEEGCGVAFVERRYIKNGKVLLSEITHYVAGGP